jgi:formylglycine-generating enzyme required for sulfatase activity
MTTVKCFPGLSDNHKKGGFRHPVITVPILLPLLLFQFGCDKKSSTAPRQAPHLLTLDSRPVVPLTNMVLIKAGAFLRQRHPVTVSRDFWLAQYEVTQGEYEALMGNNPSRFRDDTNVPMPLRRRPVERVRYDDATAYCSALTKREAEAGRLPARYVYRLPTEAEWEYACRAGTTNLFSFGDDTATADQYAWTLENSDATTHPVGLKKPNPWGLYDMHGNVWEWTLDWFVDYRMAGAPAQAVVDPTGPLQGKFKVFRGGSWNHPVEMARSANRFMMSPTNGINFVGFRVALAETVRQ